MTSRERFLKYCKDKGLLSGTVLTEIWQAAERQALERAAHLCDEYGALMANEKDSALLVGKLDLSNAMSGEPRAAEFLAKSIRALIDAQSGEEKRGD
jgi:hypothetical protein